MIFKFFNFGRYIRTIIDLKFLQIFFILKSRLLRSYPKKISDIPPYSRILFYYPKFQHRSIFRNDYVFQLNESHKLPGGEWLVPKASKLWNFHLNYFDFLAWPSDDNQRLINLWIRSNPCSSSLSWHPYVVSRRIVNWIKFDSSTKSLNADALGSLYIQAVFLIKNIEYGIQANHLLANGKALIFAGISFPGCHNFFHTGVKILERQIEEQILNDGGHFERSPMYHSIVLEDLLDVYSILCNSQLKFQKNAQLLMFKLEKKLPVMLNWILSMSHPDGRVAFFGDSFFGYAADYKDLVNYATEVGIRNVDRFRLPIFLAPSGYLVSRYDHSYLALNAGSIAPKYQPGHAHADTLSCEVSIKNVRFIVNSGVSTYENNLMRSYQRGTKAHSTVRIGRENSSEVWKSFRVGRKAVVQVHECSLQATKTKFSASHNGYRHLDAVHKREILHSARALQFIDQILGSTNIAGTLRFYFHPAFSIEEIAANEFLVCSTEGWHVRLTVAGSFSVSIIKSRFFPEIGIEMENECISIEFLEKVQCCFRWG